MLEKDIAVQQTILKTILNTDSSFLPESKPLARVVPLISNDVLTSHPILMMQQQAIAVADAELKVARRSVLPDLSGRFFSQRLYGLPDPYTGFSVSVGIPLLSMGSHKAKIRAASLERDYEQMVLNSERKNLNAAVQQIFQNLEKDKELLEYYENQGLAQATAILDAARLSYRSGEISFAELSQFMTQAIDIRKNYLDILNQYNQSAIAYAYYSKP